MSENNNEQAIPADLLSRAGAMPSGVNVETFDPMEKIPTLTVGEEWQPGQTIGGFFETVEVLASRKFIHSKKLNADGIPTSERIVLRVGSPTGDRLAIWGTAELLATAQKLNRGEFIQITYKEKGVNAKGMAQHFFEYKRQAAATAPQH